MMTHAGIATSQCPAPAAFHRNPETAGRARHNPPRTCSQCAGEPMASIMNTGEGFSFVARSERHQARERAGALLERGLCMGQHGGAGARDSNLSRRGCCTKVGRRTDQLMSRAMQLARANGKVSPLRCAGRRDLCGRSPVGRGVRLVCNSSSGADLIRHKAKGKIMSLEHAREKHRPVSLLW